MPARVPGVLASYESVSVIQAKRWSNVVGRPEIQRFVGALHGQNARKGVFITTSAFSNGAVEFFAAQGLASQRGLYRPFCCRAARAGSEAGYRASSTFDPRASIRSRKASTRRHISSEDARSYSGRSGSANRWPEQE